jgi:tripartite-type tricarboxylate transporter receptor subunit TctC
LRACSANPCRRRLGQQIVIENVAGAGGTTGAARAAKSEANGYTLLIHHVALAAGATLYPKLTYDTLTDFEGIGLVNSGPFVLTSKKGLEVNDIKSAIEYIRANKEKVTMGNAGVGSGSHLCNMLLQSTLNVKVSEVAYRGTGPAMNDLVGGQIDMLCDQSTNAMSQIQGGTIKAFAVTSATRMDQLKDLPTMQEAGLPGFEVTQWHALYAPKGTPATAIDKLSAALEKALADQKVLARFVTSALCSFPQASAVLRPPKPSSQQRSTNGARRSRRRGSSRNSASCAGARRGSEPMKITRIRDAVAPIPSPMRNAVISFDKMTISVAAVETDVVRDGKPVIGYGFTSNGRYAQSGIIRERLAPRILEADPAKLRDDAAGTLDPQAVWAAMMSNEKPGGHGDRAFAAGAIDLAVWDATAKILGKPLWRVLSERYNGGKFDERVLVYSGGGYYYPGKEKQACKTRCAVAGT